MSSGVADLSMPFEVRDRPCPRQPYYSLDGPTLGPSRQERLLLRRLESKWSKTGQFFDSGDYSMVKEGHSPHDDLYLATAPFDKDQKVKQITQRPRCYSSIPCSQPLLSRTSSSTSSYCSSISASSGSSANSSAPSTPSRLRRASRCYGNYAIHSHALSDVSEPMAPGPAYW